MKNMTKLNIDSMIFPEKAVIARCSVCNKEIKRVPYGHYEDYKRQARKLEKSVFDCPHCGAVFIVREKKPSWEKEKNGSYIAKALNGDFRVWKYGRGYKWRYRKYGVMYPDRIDWARTKDEAMRACTRHAEWKLENKAV